MSAFDTKIFGTPQVREFLANHHKHDMRLYRAVRNFSWPAKGRRTFRPVFLEQRVTTENFDEQAYLYSNPDLAAAVKDGSMKSARAHFEN